MYSNKWVSFLLLGLGAVICIYSFRHNLAFIIVFMISLLMYLKIVSTKGLLENYNKELELAQRKGSEYENKYKEVVKELNEGNNRFKSLILHNPDAIISCDLVGNILSANPAAEIFSGYPESELIQLNFRDMLVEKELVRVNQIFEEVKRGTSIDYETNFYHKQRGIITVAIKSLPIYQENEIIGVIGIIKDITESKKARALLDGQTKVLEMIAKGINIKEIFSEIVHIVEGGLDGGRCSILVADATKKKLVVGSAPSLPTEYIEDIDGLPITPRSGAASFRKEVVVSSNVFTDPLWGPYKNFALKYGVKSCWSTPILDNNLEIIGAFAVYNDYYGEPAKKDIELIEKASYLAKLAILHYEAEVKINHMAFHDPLTGLANRRLFKEQFELSLKIAKETGTEIGLLFLDLDRFKVVNDSLGHNIGDLLLQKVAERLKANVIEKHLICRQGGDEFLILLEGVSSEENVLIANRVIQALAQPIRLKDHEVVITPSIGISRYPAHGKDPDTLIRNADIAMYDAKRKGKNNFQFYHHEQENVPNDQLILEQNLRKALERGEFELHFQSQKSINSSQLSGAEALIRWKHPEIGYIPPNRFISLAEETGLIVPIGEWVVRTACESNVRWQKAGLPPIVISVNLSIRQFFQPDLIPVITRILEETGLEPQYLELEITESMTMNIDSAILILHELKSLGVRIAMDDFGTGYSSLIYLKKLPIDRLKIDQSFVRDIGKDSNDRDIVATIITMGHNLKMSVVAEGVETEEQLQFLVGHSCDEVQGYLFSKPLPEDKFLEYFTTAQMSK